MKIGAHYKGGDNCEFTVWAPRHQEVAVNLLSQRRLIPLERDERGYWRAEVNGITPGEFYVYRLDNCLERPDPASNYQPEGIHAPSQIVDHHSFIWDDYDWRGASLADAVIYELHVGTFTPEGAFEGIIPRLQELKNLGVSAIELMPVAQFPGARNWGYDGVYPYAPQNSYGGPDGLKRLVNACHQVGLGIILDVVYNHLGPEGNYLRNFGPYFTGKYHTPWGEALNFDGIDSDGVRQFFIQNALYWFREYRLDALRLDAVHAIYDASAKHFLQELAERVAELSVELGRKLYLIAESDLNDPRLIRPIEQGGFGLDAQWSDDFHHSLRTLLTGERRGYYQDFGGIGDLAKSYKQAFVYTGQYSEHRKRNFGEPPDGCSPRQFIVFGQNHDQIGNRMHGERLSNLVSFEALKLAAGAVLLSPYVPLLFMGEEYGEDRPFLYFVGHSDPYLQTAVREGRKAEFRAFEWQGEPPDPNEVSTFEASKLDWTKRNEERHGALLRLYRRLIDLRRQIPALKEPDWSSLEAREQSAGVILLSRHFGESEIAALLNFTNDAARCRLELDGDHWVKVLDSAGEEWDGPGSSISETIESDQEVALSARSFVLFERRAE